MQDAILSGVRGLLSSAALLCRGAASSGADLPAGLLAAAGGLYTYALEEYGKLLLLDSLTEKGGIVSVPLQEMFRRHGKKFKAALDSLPKECRLLGGGPHGPRLPCAEPLEATFPGRTSMLYTDIGRNGAGSCEMFWRRGGRAAEQDARVWLLGNAHPRADRSIDWDDDPLSNPSNPDALVVDFSALTTPVLGKIGRAKLDRAREIVRDKIRNCGTVIVMAQPFFWANPHHAPDKNLSPSPDLPMGDPLACSYYQIFPTWLATTHVQRGKKIVVGAEHDFGEHMDPDCPEFLRSGHSTVNFTKADDPRCREPARLARPCLDIWARRGPKPRCLQPAAEGA